MEAEGMQSIEDYQYKGSRFPFLVLDFWQHMEKLYKKQRRWHSSYEYVLTSTKDLPCGSLLEKETHDLLSQIPWGRPTRALGASADADILCRLLLDGHNGWLNDDLVDMFANLLEETSVA
jgi:hypothetical protein